MDWLKRMNAAINYIEDNITCDIDYKQIAQIACCPNYHFQRMFVFITEIPLSEYIRRRRLTLAAFDLQQSNKSIIEIAQKYGYASHSAFTRAFSEMHSIAPTSARNIGAKLIAFPRMSFHISIKGARDMSYRIEKVDAFSAVGVKYRVKTDKAFSTVPMIWQELQNSGTADKLLDLMKNNSDRWANAVFGILSEGDWGKKENHSYHVAVPHDTETPDGMDKIYFQDSLWAVFDVSTIADFASVWQRLYTEWVPTSGYSLANLPAIECYYSPGHIPQNELWIPIVKR